MHALLVAWSLALVLLTGQLILMQSRRVNGWERRRELQLLVLVAPMPVLGLAILGVHHFVEQMCLIGASGWDLGIGVAVALGMPVVALGGLILSLLRLAAMRQFLAREYGLAPSELQGMVGDLADRLGTTRPRVLVSRGDRPLAVVSGLAKPTLLISEWMLVQLDQRELASVIAHEIAHVARRDYPVVWVATLLRDAFWYLPTSRTAHVQLQHDNELACDDVAAKVTTRPLALASALVKVWQHGAGGAAFAGAQAISGTASGALIERRITRLLAPSEPSRGRTDSAVRPLWTCAATIVGLTLLEAVSIAALLSPMGCGPGWPTLGML